MEVPEPRVRKTPLSKMAFSSLSVGWLVGGCGARAASRKTPIYFRIIKIDTMFVTGILFPGKRSRPVEPQIWMLLRHTMVGERCQVDNSYFPTNNIILSLILLLE